MNRDRVIQIIAALAALAAMAASTALTPHIAAEAGRAQLAYTAEAEEGDPPEVALGVAMGAFKGLFVNILWMRAQSLKQEGKFYDAIEVARTITKLTPRFPRVWSFHGWNLAYNISVATQTPEERWQWVQSGIRLLRNEGIPKNPNAMILYKELAWIFVHKIQGFTDDANQYYKRQVAREWTFVMGPPPEDPQPQDGDVQELYQRRIAEGADPELARGFAKREAAVRRRLAILAEIAGAPSTRRALDQTSEEAAELTARINEEAGLELGFDLLRVVELLRAWSQSQSELGGQVQFTLNEDQRNRTIEELLQNERYRQAWPLVLGHTRKRLLVDEYKMELPRMMRYTAEFGPLDWRHPASHALYWAATGVEKGSTRRNVEDFDFTNTDRLVLHAVQELFRWGDLQYDVLTGSHLAMYNLSFVDVYGETIALLQDRATRFDDKDRPYSIYSAGYENHLRDVVRLYYRMGETALAQHYYEKLRTWDGLNVNRDWFLREELALPLADFVTIDLKERMTSPQVVEQEMLGALHDAYIRGILRGQPEVYSAQLSYASRVHQNFMFEQNIDTPAGGGSRMGDYFAKRFVDVAGAALARTLVSGNLGFVQAARLWDKCPTGLRQAAWDDLVARAEGAVPNFRRLFPEPPGMERYRQIRAQMSETDSDNRLLRLKTEQQ